MSESEHPTFELVETYANPFGPCHWDQREGKGHVTLRTESGGVTLVGKRNALKEVAELLLAWLDQQP